MYYTPVESFVSSEYILTSTGNRIAKDAAISKPQALEIPGGKVIIKSKVSINSSDTRVSLNKYSYISEGCMLLPSTLTTGGATRHIPMTIGAHTFIGMNCRIEAAVIGNGCFISANCTVGPRVVLKDYVLLEPNTVVAADTVIPPFCVVAGNPGVIVGIVPESAVVLHTNAAITKYKSFIPNV